MNLISAQNLNKTLGEKPLLRSAVFGINEGDRIGLIGVNGSGKSTLLKIVAGAEPLDAGTLARRQGLRVALLDQNAEFNPAHTAIEHLFSSDAPHAALVRDYELANERLHHASDDPQRIAAVGELSARMDAVGAWAFESRVRAILGHLGLAELDRPLGVLSGGERKRVSLARVLLAEPELLLLDEPTNHLDIDMVAWLEEWLAQFNGTVIVVTHDRYFLNRVTRRIWELEGGELRQYEGNFEYYLEKKAEYEAEQAKKEDRRLNQLRRELEWLRRGPKARTTKAQARKDRAAELLNTSFYREHQKVEFASGARRMGRKIVELRSVVKSFGGRPLVKGLDYTFTPGERLGVVGRNGSGKTTLVNLIAGRIAPDSGTIKTGETVKLGYYDQESAGFDLEERAINYVMREGGEALETADGRVLPASLFLNQFNFTAQMQYAPVGKLSGGERRRLYLVTTLLRDPNFLILDEPTNDLDIPTLQSLEEYLDGFQGCLLVISHDRYFLDRVVDKVIAPVGDGTWRLYPGSYSVYAETRDEEEAGQREAERRAKEKGEMRQPAAATATAANVPARKKLSFNEQRELARLESEIPQMEKRLEEIETAMAAAASDYERLHSLTSEQADLHFKLEKSTERWMELSERG